MTHDSYPRFKAAVLRRCGGLCENPNCDAPAETVHHFFKQSTYPEFKLDDDNGMGSCGRCHEEIERRLREGGDYKELYPIGRYLVMSDKVMEALQ